MPKLDLITLGRCSMDLFAQDIGADFVDITAFAAQVGGSPTNIAIGTSQLGLRTAAATAVGADPVGDFVLHYLKRKGVDTGYVWRKAGGRTSLAVLGVQPPDRFPLTFYRANAADLYITIDDVAALDFGRARALLLSGTGMVGQRDATLFAAEQARARDLPVFADLDLRPSLWDHALAYGVNIRSLLPLLDVVMGTEEEFFAALLGGPKAALSGEEIAAVSAAIGRLLDAPHGPQTVALKRGPRGVTIFERGAAPLDVAGFSVEVVNTVGAGDAFASGLIYGRLQGWGWAESGRFANACGALVVTRHGCAEAMPTLDEVREFLKRNL